MTSRSPISPAAGAGTSSCPEGLRGTIRRRGHEHRHPLLRPAHLAVRPRGEQRCYVERATARRACSSSSGRASDGALDEHQGSAVLRRPRREDDHRSIRVDGAEVEFSEGFVDLHTQVYKTPRRLGFRHRRSPSRDRTGPSDHGPPVQRGVRGWASRSRLTPWRLLRPRILVRRRRRRDRRRHQDVALLPLMPGLALGGVQHRAERRHLPRRVVIGNNVKIQNNVSVYTGVILEDDVFAGPPWCSPT